MAIYEIQSDIDDIERNPMLYEATQFALRAQAIDILEFYVLDRIEGLLGSHTAKADLVLLKQHAERVKSHLEAIDDQLFRQLRTEIRAGRCTGHALLKVIRQYVGIESDTAWKSDSPGYDILDVFINRLLCTENIPSETVAREPEMIYYQKTPVRVMLELLTRAQLTTSDVFYDIGSGLGHVPILMHLLSGVRAKGIEYEPAYCAYARSCAAELKLSAVSFIHSDARSADYSDGTIFFMYTPFEGRMLQAVLEKLRVEAQRRSIRLFTYGPCTAKIAEHPWLAPANQPVEYEYQLGSFRSG